MNNIKEAVAGYIGLGLFIVFIILGLYVFSYILIFGALIGLVLYSISFVRLKFFSRQYNKPKEEKQSHRTIDHDPNE